MNKMNDEVKAYFDTLPISVQSAIIESGATFKTVEQLKMVAKAFMEKYPEIYVEGDSWGFSADTFSQKAAPS